MDFVFFTRGRALVALLLLGVVLHVSAFASGVLTDEDARRFGSGHVWQGGPTAVNLYSMCKTTAVPIVNWRARGGLPVSFGLYHSSKTKFGNNTLGTKWQHTGDTHLEVWSLGGALRAALVMGDHKVSMFHRTGSVWTPSDGYRNVLAAVGNDYEVTLRDQVVLRFAPVPLLGNAIPVAKRYLLDWVRDPNGNTVDYQYDGLNRLVRIEDPSARTVSLSYLSGRLSTIDFKVPGGFVRTWTCTYDAVGRLIRVDWPVVTTDSGPQTYYTAFGYNAAGNIVSKTDAEGHTWLYGYSGDQVAFEQWPGNAVNERVLYSSAGNLRTVTDPLGNASQYEYDGLARLIRRQDTSFFDIWWDFTDLDYAYGVSRVLMPSGTKWKYDYDARGNLMSRENPAGEQWDYSYDSRNNLVQALAPLVTDAYGNVEPGRHRTDYAYDANSNCVLRKGFTDPVNFLQTQFVYDAFGQLTSVINPLNRTWAYQYDAYGNLVRTTTPMGRFLRIIYDTAALSVGFTVPNAWADSNGLRTGLLRDEWGRLRRIDYLNDPDRTYSYDGLSRLVTAVDSAPNTFVYDANGSLIQTARGTWSCSYTHDANGRRQSMSENSGTGPHSVQYSYNPRGLVASIVDNGFTTAFTYDSDGRCVKKDLGNGAETQFAYLNGRLSQVVQLDGLNSPFLNRQYSYQANGALMSVVEGGNANRYDYDFLDRLVREERIGATPYDHLYQYDNAGNRTAQSLSGMQTTFAYDPDKNLVQALPQGMQPELYTYDQNGRLFERVRNNGTERFQFGYTTNGSLATMQQWNGQVFQPAADYQYDALGRRVVRNAFTNGNQSAHVDSFFDVFCEIRLDGVYNGNSRTDQMTWAAFADGHSEVDGLIVQNIVNGPDFWAATDGLGNQGHTTNNGGGQTNFAAIYDAFGNTMSQSGTPTRYRWGADKGIVTEGDASLLARTNPSVFGKYEDGIASSGSQWTFYDPKTGLSLPSGPNIDGSSKDAAYFVAVGTPLADIHNSLRLNDSCIGSGGLFGPTINGLNFGDSGGGWFGNANGDADVDGRDFLRWQRGNSPTAVDAADYVLCRRTFNLGPWQNPALPPSGLDFVRLPSLGDPFEWRFILPPW